MTVLGGRWDRVRAVVVDGLRLLTGAERRTFGVLTLLVACVEAVQVGAVVLVLPVVGGIVQPDMLAGSAAFGRLQARLDVSRDGLVLLLGLAAFVLIVAGQVSGYLLQVAIQVFTARAQTRLARELMAECVATPYPWFLHQNASALARLFHNDVGLWGRDLVASLLRLLTQILVIVASAALVLAAASLAAVVLLAAVLVLAYVAVRFVRPRLLRWTSAKRRAAEETMVIETHLLSGIKDIKVSRSPYFVEIFATTYGAMSHAAARMLMLSQVPGAALVLLGQASLLVFTLVLWQSGRPGGEIASTMALVVLITSRVVPAISQLSATITSLVNVTPWVGGILELRRSFSEARARHPESSGRVPVPRDWREIAVRDVTFRYPGNARPVLHDVTLRLERGGAYGVVGPSGAGKSTLVDLLLGLLVPESGRILVDGVPLAELDLAAWQRRIGYVPQTPYFTDDTIRANVAFGMPHDAVDEARVRRCLEMASLGEFLAALPRGVDASLGDRAVNISGGERQRIAIARALYREPDLLVLDEATSALDPASQQAVARAIDALRGQVTTIVISHQTTAIAACDRVLVLDGGRLVAEGRFEDVLLSAGRS